MKSVAKVKIVLNRFLTVLTFFGFGIVCFSQSLRHVPVREYTGQTIWDLPDVPEEQVDIGLWALIIEKENNPSLDIPASLREIDRWVRVINSVIADRSQDVFVMAAISDVMWERGPWNEYRHPTPQEQQEIERYDREGNEYLNAAKKLGWRDVTEEDRESYLDGIRQGKRVDSEGRR